MKGLIFLKPLEYSIEITGERWRQGEKVKGSIRVKNQGLEKIDLPFIKAALAIGNFKKIKAKDKKGWDYFPEVILSEGFSLGASEEKECTFDFTLPEDCQITEKDKSIYVTFKTNDDYFPTAQLELVIDPKLVILQFLEILESFLRFKVAQTKFSKGMIEVKLNPPNSRELSHVDSVIMRMKEVEKNLHIEYTFNTLSFQMVEGNMIPQKKTKEARQSFSPGELFVYGSLNQDFIVKSVGDLITSATPRIMV
jgi:hypothetical protein